MATKNLFKHEAKQFCLNTALHGFRFIVLPKRVLLERSFWVVVVIVSFASAAVLMFISWNTFQENPTILLTDSTHYPIWNYPFPAVSICSFNKFSKNRTYQLAAKLEKPYGESTEALAQKMRILFQLIYNNNDKIPFKNYSMLQDVLEMNDCSIEEVLDFLAPTCSELLQRCKWKGEEQRCDSLFEKIKTTEGYCCAFNYYALKNHRFSGVLTHKIPKQPRRVSACGHLTALEVLVNSDPSDYFATQIAAIGHRVLIHNSYHFPDWSINNILTEKGTNNLIGIAPSITYSTSSIKDMNISKRKCFFSNESHLHNFAEYNFHNCLVECRMNLTKNMCGCIPFYYFSKTGTYPKSRICNLRDVQCLSEYRSLLVSSVPGYDFAQVAPDHQWGLESPSCNCLPDCDYVDYVAEASAGIFTRKYASNQMNLFGGIVIQHQSVVRVFFNDLVATKNRRDMVFSWHTLLAYYGGLLGLFTGFSFISAIEFVYFFSVRLIINFVKSNQKHNEKKRRQLFNVKLHKKNLTIPGQFMLRHRSNSNSENHSNSNPIN